MPHFDTEYNVLARQLHKRLEEIYERILGDRRPIEGWESVVTGRGQGPSSPPRSGWKPFTRRRQWGGQDVTMWLRARIVLPRSMAGKHVSAFLRPGGESLCYVNGSPRQGVDANRSEVLLSASARTGQTFSLCLECYSNPRFTQMHTFEPAFVASIDPLIRDFYWDARVAMEVADVLPEGSMDRGRLWNLLDRCLGRVDLQRADDREALRRSVRGAQRDLRVGLTDLGGSKGLGSLVLAGHSHIDTAWLWPLRETRRKCGRTFSTVLHYMEQFPEYCFTQSQPQLYEFVKTHYPKLYEGIRQRVKEGRWEPIGGGWVEQDSNMAGGEALVRQYLYGNRFFRSEFGIDNRTCWLPDAFGFPLSLPQILRKAGITTFVTTKISWNQYNRFPYSLFRWKGLDGTEVLALMPPLNYNGNVRPNEVLEHWNRFRQKDEADELIFSFGWGDGGGGPTSEMIETGRRLANIVGVPRCSFGKVQDSMDRLHRKVRWDRLPVCHDELYLELHRGCQTSQARTKRNNRKCELLYRDAEFFGVLAGMEGGDACQERLHEGWKMLLTNQFHDILPGSSIGEVYADADRSYESIRRTGEDVRARALRHFTANIDTRGESRPVIVHNTLSWERTDVAAIPLPAERNGVYGVLDSTGVPVPVQRTADGKSLLFLAQNVSAMGHSVYRLVGKDQCDSQSTVVASRTRLESFRYDIELDDKGTITSLMDKLNRRQVIPAGMRANVLQLFDDRPHDFDAWEIDFNIDRTQWEMDRVTTAKVIEKGPVRTVLRVEKRTERSRLRQDLILYEHLPRIDFVTEVDWREKRLLMKAAFPVEVCARTATYEIQYGAIERDTHHSTSWQRARFENPAHRWIDLSEGDYGVSLLNDCKYGFDVYGNCMRISLLRSPVIPDPHADEGRHRFTYSLYPHSGDWRSAHTVRRAAELNVPLLTTLTTNHAGRYPAEWSFASVDSDHVVVDAVKQAEDSEHAIVRLYEAHGRRGPTTLTFGRRIRTVTECNLMEEDDQPTEHDAQSIRFFIKPFEIRTFKVRF